uniref:G domain-containing protein n=1 Tax=Parastrongyloides trichosuri TaxID=131310 RepID=A0A0N5A6F5_PARTI
MVIIAVGPEKKGGRKTKGKGDRSLEGSIDEGGGKGNTKQRRRKKQQSIEMTQTVDEPNHPVKRRKSNRKKGAVVEITTKKIVHDPKLIGALPSLPLFYQQIVSPVKDRHQYNEVTKTVGWNSSEIVAKPTILVLGSDGSGKTTFINYLLREKKGYDSYVDAVRDHKNCFTHIIYDEKPVLFRGDEAGMMKNWHLNEITKFNKDRNDCQIQVLQIKNPLLEEITIIDSPKLTNLMLKNMNDDTGYFPLLKNLIRKIDMIIFLATPQIIGTDIARVIQLLSPHISKTIFCLNKCDIYRSFDLLSKDRKRFTDFVTASVVGEPKIICTYFKGVIKNEELKKHIHTDNDYLLLRLKKFPFQYKLARTASLNVHMLEVLYVAFLQHEIKRSDKKYKAKTLLPEEIEPINKCLSDLPNNEKFLKDHAYIPEAVMSASENIKPKYVKAEDIEALRMFLINDFPYIQTVASGEPEVLVKTLLPLADPNKDPEPPKKEKKKVIKEIKIALPQDDEDEDDDDDDDKAKGKKPKKHHDKQKFVKLDKNVIENIMKQ